MIEPYYNEDGVRIFCGDCREVVPELGLSSVACGVGFDLLLTDPPYGLNRDKGMGGKGFSFGGHKRISRSYRGDWDSCPVDEGSLLMCLESCQRHIVWGGNYLSGMLPQNGKWLVWDKVQTMPSYSDAELAWTSLSGSAVKMFRYNGAGMMAKEKDRQHPTQKPVSLMIWCLQQAGEGVRTVLDPFMGSGTTLVAAKLRGLQAVGIELNRDYCDMAVERLRQRILLPA